MNRITKIVSGVVLAGAVAASASACVTPAQATMLARLRQCETGSNYRTHVWVGGTEYGGAYGFDVRIWRAQGHSPDPQYAAPWYQDQVELQDIAMLGVHRSNPGCAAKLGL